MYPTPNDKTYVLYVRKSTESEDRQMHSIDDQKKTMLDLAKRNGIVVSEVIEDIKSAKAPNKRTGFDRMIKLIESGKIDGILCWHLNRLARNGIDGGRIIWILQKKFLKHIVTHSVEYTPQSNLLMLYVEFGMANQFIVGHSAVVSRGMRQKAERGWRPHAQLPLGYLHCSGRKCKKCSSCLQGKRCEKMHSTFGGVVEIIPDPIRFPIVKKLWRMMVMGKYSIQELFKFATSMGLTNLRDKLISQSSLYHMFKNEFYAGYFTYKGEDGQAVRVKGKHRPTVTENEFERILARFNKLRTPRLKQNHSSIYQGLIRCGSCQRAIIAERKEHTRCTECSYKFSSIKATACPKCDLDIIQMKSPTTLSKVYFRCCGRNKGKEGGCNEPSFEKAELDVKVHKLIKGFYIPKDIYDLIVEASGVAYENLNTTATLEDEERRRKLKTLEQKLNDLALYASKVDMSKEQYDRSCREVQVELKKLTEHIIETKESKFSFVRRLKNETEFVTRLQKIMENPPNDLKRELLVNMRANLQMSGKHLYLQGDSLLKAITGAVQELNRIISRGEPRNSLQYMAQIPKNDLFEMAIPVCEHYLRKGEP